MALEKPPLHTDRAWATWFTKLWTVVVATNSSGTTAQRPTSGLYIGMTYFDTTISRPIWLQSANPSVWINAAGGVV